jgi:hypothetical protein
MLLNFLDREYIYFLKQISATKISRRYLTKNIFTSGTVSGRFQKSDPVKKRQDP